ncbi:MAG: ABC transporter permease subunit, partial [Clostridia bacterium]
MEQFIDVTLQLLNGFGTNVFLFVVTLAFSIPLGLVITFGSMSKFKPLALLTKLFIWVMRGTPLMLQIFVVFYLPGFLGYPMQSRLLAVQIAFAINYAAYFSEIYRGGIESIPKGQYEAGKVLGMTKSQIFKN